MTKPMAIEVVLEAGHRYRGCVHDYNQPQDNNPIYVTSSYSTYEDAENVAKRWLAARSYRRSA